MILRELSQAVGVSGKEDAVRRVIAGAVEAHVTDLRVDAMGNLTGVQHGTGEAPLRVMLAAHMDEVGLMATAVDSDGLIRFAAVGGLDDRILPGLRVRVGDNLIPGCIVWTPIHQNREQNVVKLANLRIDIGATSKENANGQVKVGDRIAFDGPFMELGESMLRGRAFDDRVGCALLVEALQGGPYPVDVLAAFTAQEEIGVRGATVAAQRLMPDVALVLESAPAHDLPNPRADADDEDEPNPVARLGRGPVLTVMDRSMIVHPRLLAFLRQTAEREGIPYQFKSAPGGGTDGGAIHTSNSGVPTAVISVASRYIHSPAALLHRDDYANALRLVQAALHGISDAGIVTPA